MICHRDTGPCQPVSPCSEDDSQLPQPVSSTRNGHKLGWFLPSPPQEPALTLRCQTQTRLVLIQGVQKSPVGGLEPRCHLPRAEDPGASARKDATTSFAGTMDKPLGLEPFMTPVPRASGRDCATHPHDDTTAPTAGWDPQLAG